MSYCIDKALAVSPNVIGFIHSTYNVGDWDSQKRLNEHEDLFKSLKQSFPNLCYRGEELKPINPPLSIDSKDDDLFFYTTNRSKHPSSKHNVQGITNSIYSLHEDNSRQISPDGALATIPRSELTAEGISLGHSIWKQGRNLPFGRDSVLELEFLVSQESSEPDGKFLSQKLKKLQIFRSNRTTADRNGLRFHLIKTKEGLRGYIVRALLPLVGKHKEWVVHLLYGLAVFIQYPPTPISAESFEVVKPSSAWPLLWDPVASTFSLGLKEGRKRWNAAPLTYEMDSFITSIYTTCHGGQKSKHNDGQRSAGSGSPQAQGSSNVFKSSANIQNLKRQLGDDEEEDNKRTPKRSKSFKPEDKDDMKYACLFFVFYEEMHRKLPLHMHGLTPDVIQLLQNYCQEEENLGPAVPQKVRELFTHTGKGCGQFRFSRKKELLEHIKDFHTGKTRCEDCHKTYCRKTIAKPTAHKCRPPNTAIEQGVDPVVEATLQEYIDTCLSRATGSASVEEIYQILTDTKARINPYWQRNNSTLNPAENERTSTSDTATASDPPSARQLSLPRQIVVSSSSSPTLVKATPASINTLHPNKDCQGLTLAQAEGQTPKTSILQQLFDIQAKRQAIIDGLTMDRDRTTRIIAEMTYQPIPPNSGSPYSSAPIPAPAESRLENLSLDMPVSFHPPMAAPTLTSSWTCNSLEDYPIYVSSMPAIGDSELLLQVSNIPSAPENFPPQWVLDDRDDCHNIYNAPLAKCTHCVMCRYKKDSYGHICYESCECVICREGRDRGL